MQKVGSVTETADQNSEFTNGNVAQGVQPTILESAIFNTWQREMCNVVEGSGISLDPKDDGQVLKAIKKTNKDQAPAALSGNGYQKLPSGLIIQWLSGVSGNDGVMSLPLPIPFPTEVLGGVVNEGNPVGWNENDATIWGFDLPSSSKTTAVARVRKISGQLGPAPAGPITGRIFVWGF